MPSGEQDFQSNYHYFLSFFKLVNPRALEDVLVILSGQIPYKFYFIHIYDCASKTTQTQDTWNKYNLTKHIHSDCKNQILWSTSAEGTHSPQSPTIKNYSSGPNEWSKPNTNSNQSHSHITRDSIYFIKDKNQTYDQNSLHIIDNTIGSHKQFTLPNRLGSLSTNIDSQTRITFNKHRVTI